MDDLKSILESLTPIKPKSARRSGKIKTPKSLIPTCDHDHEIDSWQALALCNMPNGFYARSHVAPGECYFIKYASEISNKALAMRKAAGLE